MIDTHCHIDDKKFSDDLAAVIERAKSEGIKYLIAPSVDLKSFDRIKDISESYPGFIYPVPGIHPSEANNYPKETKYQLHESIKQFKPIAIGEIGLDYYWVQDNKEAQKKLFSLQLQIAETYNLPVIIHNRSAIEDCLELLNRFKLKAVFHCFSEEPRFAYDLIDAGYFISFTGNITYPKSQGLRELIKELPLEKILLETDSPYLSPQKKRGRRNEPANIKFIYEVIAELKGIEIEKFIPAIENNVKELFTKI